MSETKPTYDELAAQNERLRAIAIAAHEMQNAPGPREELRAERRLRSLVDAVMPDLLEPAASLERHDAAVRAAVRAATWRCGRRCGRRRGARLRRSLLIA